MLSNSFIDRISVDLSFYALVTTESPTDFTKSLPLFGINDEYVFNDSSD